MFCLHITNNIYYWIGLCDLRACLARNIAGGDREMNRLGGAHQQDPVYSQSNSLCDRHKLTRYFRKRCLRTVNLNTKLEGSGPLAVTTAMDTKHNLGRV